MGALREFRRMDDTSRRAFLARAAAAGGAVWLWPQIAAAAAHAHRTASSGEPAAFAFFTPEQAVEIEAATACIVPTDDAPGAREAGCVYFIDRALVTFDSDKQELYRTGVATLQAKTAELAPGVDRFSAATTDQQIAVLTALEKSEFFGLLRQHTLWGFLCDPGRGGNRDQVGWKAIGFEDQHVWEPPFGFYDRNYPGWEPTK